jgi:hypothetical protein
MGGYEVKENARLLGVLTCDFAETIRHYCEIEKKDAYEEWLQREEDCHEVVSTSGTHARSSQGE